MSSNRDAFFQAIEAFNHRDLDRYLELYDDGLQLHGYSEKPMTKTEARGFYEGVFAAISDTKLEIHHVIEDAAEQHLCARFTMTGTHAGEFFGVPGTGRPVSQDGITILRFRDGRVVERWSTADTLAVLIQIGAVSPG